MKGIVTPYGGPWLLLALATAALVTVVPDWPHRHLDDPSYWGLLGYAVVFASLTTRVDRPFGPGTANRRIVVAFLVGLPLIYVANWFRFGTSEIDLLIQLGGAVAWIGLAMLARRSDLALWAGCAAHAAWDAAHFGRVDFVPGWYVAACMAVDVGLGAFVLLRLRKSDPSAPADPGGRLRGRRRR